MSRKRILLAAVVLAVCGWAVGISFSLSQLWDSLPDLGAFGRSPAAAPATVPSPHSIPPSAASPIEAVREIPPAEVRVEAREEEPEEPRALQPTVRMTVEERCEMLLKPAAVRPVTLFEGTPAAPLLGVFPTESSGRLEFYRGLSEAELKAMADSNDDGLAQFLYAHRVMWRLRAMYPRDVPPEVRGHELFQAMEKYYIKTIGNHSRQAATWLSRMYWPIDKTEARAWLVVQQKMGGDSLTRIDNDPNFPYTDEQKSEGITRAEELIAELELAEALALPEGCRVELGRR